MGMVCTVPQTHDCQLQINGDIYIYILVMTRSIERSQSYSHPFMHYNDLLDLIDRNGYRQTHSTTHSQFTLHGNSVFSIQQFEYIRIHTKHMEY